MMRDDMKRLARAWLEEHGDPFPDGLYSSSGNRFLWLAEEAFGVELQRWREEHAPDLPEQPAPNSGCFLYRLWASDGRLLYVGVSTRLRNRLASHQRRWGDLIGSVTWEEHPDERSMLAAEAEAIANEDPALNKAGVR